jgi:hypothetical protein
MDIFGHDSRGSNPEYALDDEPRNTVLRSSNNKDRSRSIMFIFVLQYFTCGSSETAIFVEAFLLLIRTSFP